MPTAECVSIAEAVKDALNAGVAAGTFARTFEAVRSYADWDEALADDDNALHVDVVLPQTGAADSLATRGSAKLGTPVEIGVRKKLGFSEQESSTGRISVDEVDDLQYLVQQLRTFFMAGRLTGYTTAAWTETAPRLTFHRQHLRELRQFTAFLRITFESRVAL